MSKFLHRDLILNGKQPQTNIFLNALKLKPIEIKENSCEEKIENFIKPESTLHKYQNHIRIKLNQFLSSEDKRIVVHMPTGSGKTKNHNRSYL